ncbi:5-formyltetrahydrofolate cyclo-ligase [Pedobacter sp.]|uniref:5-formyltetrahydrofolate cyclo-ligase n=1 Tax=Pedobacter sp. TaxID=1411316 RepID=UPI003D7FBBE8
MNKAEIRKTATQQRNSLTAQQLQQLSEQLLLQFIKFDFSAIHTIHLFLPIEKKNEPNTFLFIDWLQQNHPSITILVPRADFNTAMMTHHVYKDVKGLTKNVFDILEPQNENEHQGTIDMVLIPLLAFDQQGYRVGYGKGFYDRFLQRLTTKKIGLSLFPPVEQIADSNEHDVRLDLCLTPESVYVFN